MVNQSSINASSACHLGIHGEHRLQRAGRQVQAVDIECGGRRYGADRRLVGLRPDPPGARTIHLSTRLFSPNPGQRKSPAE